MKTDHMYCCSLYCCSPPCLQSRIEEIGQALLKNTLLAAPNGLRNKRQGAATGGLLAGGTHRQAQQCCNLPCTAVAQWYSAAFQLLYRAAAGSSTHGTEHSHV